ncbi:hypothetical protein Skr01_48220 [Sphaerisporangium krabiense]|nr:hypothetical protein Skr01_48220 [Sphaerisporangium krabiense]
MPAVTSNHRDGGGVTPADVHHKVFSTVRFREGYDMAEVDGFLAQVEATLTGLLHERAVLTARLGALPRSGDPSQTSAGENVARIVAVAQQAADQVIRDAHEQAAEIITQAHARADAVEDAAAAAAAVRERDAATRHRAAMAELDGLRSTRERRIHELYALTRDYGARFTGSMESQARQIHALVRDLERQADALLRELDPSSAHAAATEQPAAEDAGPLGRTPQAAGPSK